MKRIFLLAVFILLIAPTCFAGFDKTATEQNEQIAQAFYGYVIKGNYQEAYLLCSPQMQEALRSADGVQHVWTQIQQSSGHYLEHQQPYLTVVGDQQFCYFFHTAFAKENLIIQVTVQDEQIAGWFVRRYFLSQ